MSETGMDKRDIEKLLRDKHDDLILFASGFRHCRMLAEDIVQECSLDLWNLAGSGYEIGNPFHYLLRMVRNRCIDTVRKSMNAGVRDGMMTSAEPSCPDESARIESRDMLRLIGEEIERLPENQRTVFRMKDMLFLENHEIAEIMDISEENVRQLLCRARKSLRLSVMKSSGYEKSIY